MVYNLVDESGNKYALNGELIPAVIRGSMGRTGESFSIAQEIVSKSFLPGSLKVGSSRVEERSFNLTTDFSFITDADFDEWLNKLLFWLNAAVTLEDTTNEKQATIAIKKLDIAYDEGSVKRSGSASIVIALLDGFWEDLNEVTLTPTIEVGTNNIEVYNTGVLPTYAKFTIEAQDECPQLDIYIDETKEGLQLVDETLGQAGFDELTIDNKEGTLYIEDFDRSSSITAGSGYFPFPVGSSTLVIETPAMLICNITYRRRYYI